MPQVRHHWDVATRVQTRPSFCARVIFIALAGVLPIIGTGCGGWPWWETKKTIDPTLYAQSGAARVEQMELQAATLAKATPDEQSRLCATLLTQLQTEPDPLVRMEIIRAAQKCPNPQADTILVAAVKDPNPYVRVMSCKALGSRKGPESSRALAETLASDLNTDVRLAATKALGEHKYPAAVSALSIALDDKDPAMQYRAMASMKTVSGQNFGEDLDKWRQYAKSISPPSGNSSIAERPAAVNR